jgi:two-component system, chemotaxis family, protein-glutamate methylesterase/glutaminase
VAHHRNFDAHARWTVAIGGSGGSGLNDLRELLGQLPPKIACVIMIVLHRPWDGPSYTRDILNAATALPVITAADGERLETGTVYIGEPSQHMTLGAHGCCKVIGDSGRKYRNRTVDLLLKSVAANASHRKMIGVILSGSLDDGSRGLAAIYSAGGITMVRSPSNPPWDAMPKNAINFGNPVDLIGDFKAIALGIRAACGVWNS